MRRSAVSPERGGRAGVPNEISSARRDERAVSADAPDPLLGGGAVLGVEPRWRVGRAALPLVEQHRQHACRGMGEEAGGVSRRGALPAAARCTAGPPRAATPRAVEPPVDERGAEVPWEEEGRGEAVPLLSQAHALGRRAGRRRRGGGGAGEGPERRDRGGVAREEGADAAGGERGGGGDGGEDGEAGGAADEAREAPAAGGGARQLHRAAERQSSRDRDLPGAGAPRHERKRGGVHGMAHQYQKSMGGARAPRAPPPFG